MRKYINYFFRLLKENFFKVRNNTDIVLNKGSHSGLRVMSFNVRRDVEDDKDNNWVNRRESIIKMILDKSPDIICFQEVMPNMCKYLVDSLNKYYDGNGIEIFTGRRLDKCNFVFGEGLYVMWRRDKFKFKKRNVYKLHDYRILNLRRLLEVELCRIENNETIHILNTHLCHGKQVNRDLSYEFIDKLIVDNQYSEFYLCGDFNEDKSWHPNGNMSLLCNKYSHNNRKNPDDTSISFFGKKKSYTIIDYIFSNKPLIDSNIITESYGISYLSDHYPIIVDY